MKSNNIHHESIPSVPCGIALMPMKEVYEMMADNVSKAHNALITASSSKFIRQILQEIYEYQLDNRVSEDIRSMVENIKSNVRAMHLNDYTRSDMCKDLESLVITLYDAIEKEDRSQKAAELRNIFLYMADHAEEYIDGFYQSKNAAKQEYTVAPNLPRVR